MAEQDDDGAKAQRAAGKVRVREILITPLAALKRPNGTPAAAYDQLADQLFYMREDALRGLVEFVLRVVAGDRLPITAAPPRCPPPALIRCWAYALQPPPPQDSDYLHSLIRSVMGREARDGGWHVELFRHARKAGPPPAKYLRHKLIEASDDNRRKMARVRELIAAGVADPSDRQWLEAWQADARLVEALVDEGDARRAAKADAGVDAA